MHCMLPRVHSGGRDDSAFCRRTDLPACCSGQPLRAHNVSGSGDEGALSDVCHKASDPERRCLVRRPQDPAMADHAHPVALHMQAVTTVKFRSSRRKMIYITRHNGGRGNQNTKQTSWTRTLLLADLITVVQQPFEGGMDVRSGAIRACSSRSFSG